MDEVFAPLGCEKMTVPSSSPGLVRVKGLGLGLGLGLALGLGLRADGEG